MKKYIECEAVKEKLQPAVNDPDSVDFWEWQCSEIDTIPAADVLPVVFCRDCKNSYEWANVDGDNYRYCGYLLSRWNHDTDRMVYDGDYCKWGRKREES